MREENDVLDKLYDLERRIMGKFEDMEKSFTAQLQEKVSYKNFWAVLGILMTIVMSMFGVLYYKIDEVQRNVIDTQKITEKIQGKLDPYDIVIKE